MSRKIAPVPKNFRTVTPTLVVRGADAAFDYYGRVFGAETLSRTVAEDGVTVLQADLKIGNSIVRLMDELPAFGILSPLGIGGSAVGLHLYLADIDEVWEAALANGAGVLMPLADVAWGERFGKLVDPFGHVWSVARRIAVATKPTEPEKPGAFSVHEPRADRTLPTAEHAMVRHAETASDAAAA